MIQVMHVMSTVRYFAVLNAKIKLNAPSSTKPRRPAAPLHSLLDWGVIYEAASYLQWIHPRTKPPGQTCFFKNTIEVSLVCVTTFQNKSCLFLPRIITV